MNEIFLESKDFKFPQKFTGYESKVYLYDYNSLIKIFKTDDINVLNNKLQKLKLLRSLSTNDVLPTDLVYIDGIFKGYKSVYRQDFNPIDCLKQNKKTKYYVLKRVLEKMKYYHSLGIILGDLHEENILFNKNDNEVILCDLDNFWINNLDFDTKNNYQIRYLQNHNSMQYMDEYIFNLLTISYIQKIAYPYVLSYLRRNGLKGILNSKENQQILEQMYKSTDNYNGDLFLNHLKKRILK